MSTGSYSGVGIETVARGRPSTSAESMLEKSEASFGYCSSDDVTRGSTHARHCVSDET